MKFETLNGILTFMLGVLVVAGVILAVRMILLTHDLRTLQKEATKDQTLMVRTEQIYNDAAVYNQKYQSPDLARILQTLAPAKPATH